MIPVPNLPTWVRPVVAAALLGGVAPALATDPLVSADQPGIPSKVLGGDLPSEGRMGNVLAVPIPTSDPTLGTGLIGVTSYFWDQTEAQQAVQPPSVTALGGMYTDSDSWAAALGQTLYWDEDRWRLMAGVATIDLNLPLLGINLVGVPVRLDWEIDGEIVFSELLRSFARDWYGGLAARYLNLAQTFTVAIASEEFALPLRFEAASLGPVLVRDSRDSTTYPRAGNYFRAGGLYTRKGGETDARYWSLDLSFSSYHAAHDNVVVAWRAKWCERQQGVPLWDACRVGLRGFPATDYLGRSSQMAEVEARWQFSRRWGLVAFGGVGQVRDSLAVLRDSDPIPSIGIGLRFLAQQAQRINLRLDYARSEGKDAVYFFVGEAF